MLKNLLRAKGLRYADVARELGVGERTVKRYLAGHGMTIEVLQRFGELVDLSLSELTRLAEQEVDPRPAVLTDEQERILSENLFNAFVFRMLRYGWPPEDIRREFELDEPEFIQCLVFLDRLRLIDLLPGNRVKLLTRKVIEWRPDGPVRRAFDKVVKQGFAEMDYSQPSAMWDLKTIKLSRSEAARLKAIVTEFSAAVMELGEEARTVHRQGDVWYAVLMAIRPVEPADLRGQDPSL
ncbi:hypothetical protein ACFB49_32650 [Sphingomonas sp. DBB INV C78]|uniref:helix-turn-helix domain-containing protein n=1 Tax=Sphingomonas sp. DBB INV C78 TaxID=3349434 RepID=UPI0036D3C51A